MPRKKRASSPLDLYDDDFDEDASSHSSQPPVQRNAANARERMRMRVLSSAYGRLKTKLPNIPPDTKLSKLDTLRLATLYIKQLINAVETGNGTANANPTQSGAALAAALDTRNLATDCTNDAAAATTTFNFHNAGQLGMSWPFEFHQHLQHGHNRNSNSNLTFASARMDWQSSQTQSYPKTLRQESHMATDVNYTQLQDAHWYPTDMGLQLEQTRAANGCCAYESAGLGQHQRSITISTSQAHSL
ncbi:neurogenic differentiation factor 2 [Drosophila novamexicana]|uniref:neurogenic differentiation factor 2 n=1 Tax=Drosophila novamexicana TaxID=47314 RepID=UPI0011E5F1A1|nr:neurogenic differentiation factor 2 [Drosophila novamexicana]